MDNFFDLLKTLYTKQRICYTSDIGQCIALTKCLSKDKDNLSALKKCIPFLFYIEPEHYFYMLFFNIPKKQYVPKMMKLSIEEEKEDKLYNKIKYILNWSDKELKLNKSILDKTINKEIWNKELAIK